MKKCNWLIVGFLLLSVVFTGNSFAAETKIGVVNVRQIVTQSEAGKKARAALEVKMKALQAEFQAEEQGLKKMQEEIQKKTSVWSEEVKAEKIRELQMAGRKFQDKNQEAQLEMKQMEEKELAPIIQTLEQVLNKYGKDNGYTVILEVESGLPYFAESTDISNAVIKRLNSAMAAKK